MVVELFAWLCALAALPLFLAHDAEHPASEFTGKAAQAHRSLRLPVQLPASSHAQCSPMVVAQDWRSVKCDPGGVVTPEEMSRLKTTNAINPSITKEHHPIFSQFLPWDGTLHPGDAHLLVDFLGFTIPRALYCNPAYISQPLAHALRVLQCSIFPQVHNTQTAVQLQTAWPVVSEEYFEYADVLSAAADYASEGPGNISRSFCFVELGAGYGHWTFAAHKALQQVAPGAPHRYLMVDVVTSLVPAVEELEKLNGVAPGAASFHVGYVAASDSETGLNKAQIADGKRMVDVYSGHWGTGHTADDKSAAIRTVSLRTLFREYNLPLCIDMIDVDIQGSEYGEFMGHNGLFYGTDSIDLMNTRVRRVHIGIHAGAGSGVQITKLIEMFESNKWRRVWFFPPTGKVGPRGHAGDTAWGPVEFRDGVLSYINENPELQCPLVSSSKPKPSLLRKPAPIPLPPAPIPMPAARPPQSSITAKLADLNEGLAAGLLTEAEYAALRAAALAKFASS